MQLGVADEAISFIERESPVGPLWVLARRTFTAASQSKSKQVKASQSKSKQVKTSQVLHDMEYRWNMIWNIDGI
jgi:hypothetical protein